MYSLDKLEAWPKSLHSLNNKWQSFKAYYGRDARAIKRTDVVLTNHSSASDANWRL
jgi:hypothetical protein